MLTLATAIVGTVEAAEAVKVAAGVGKTLAGRLILVSALEAEAQVFNLPADPDCQVCAAKR